MMRIDIEQIGGGKVIRGFIANGQHLKRGTILTQEFIKQMPVTNRNVLIEKDYIQVWPKPVAVSPPVADVARTAERHVVALGFGRYNVIEGAIINDKALTKEDAHALAGKPMETRKRA